MPAAIATEGLTKRFGNLTAVDHLDLDVATGEVFGFLGPNGAGKTTTIRLLLDVLRPSEGRALVLGRPTDELDVRRRIGFLPAELHLDRRHTVGEAIRYLGDLRGGFPGSVVDALLERFALDPTRRIGELSTGNRRKVGVVVAFAGPAELLILDEPTNGLDPLLQHELLGLIEERVGEGVTVFLSSHVLPEVERVADRVGILRQGQLALVGSTADLRARARQRVDLHLASSAAAVGFAEVPGVVSSEVHGNVVSLTVEGPIDPVVKYAARHATVERIVSPEGDLEETFLELYR